MREVSDANSEDELLALVCTISNGWYVSSQNIVWAGRLVEKGFARVDDEYEGPQLSPTKEGIAVALNRGLIVKATDGCHWGDYERVRHHPEPPL